LIRLAVGRLVGQPDALCLDCDAALLFELHAVEELRLLLAHGNHACHVEKPVGQSAFAVIDVRDDAEVPNVLEILRQSATGLASRLAYSNVA
jgi:hypothetical protein